MSLHFVYGPEARADAAISTGLLVYLLTTSLLHSIAAAAPSVPDPLIEQLAPDGIMLIPVGRRGFFQDLIMIEKDAEGNVSRRNWGGVAFVPLTGEFGH